ncbi:MAG TPA: adenylate/guanylate cyclase domain-containing protein [Gaiellaceae bacterium]
MPVCAACGQDNPEIARFCLSCGAPLSGREVRQERKVVTVLFADLVGFTSRAEALDPEDVGAMLEAYHSRLKLELERHGGTVEKFIGDAVMALFGAPVAHEDDPERAVRAALQIRSAIADLNDADPERDLHVRIGITTGEALVTLDARPDAGEGMAAGDVVNTAARLQAAAPEDGILVDESTWRSAAHAFEWREHEAVAAKGKVDPVTAWEVVGAQSSFGVDVEQDARTPLVGRARERAVLGQALERVRTERAPQLVTLIGVPGIGKSRLIWELFGIVDADPDLITWRQGRCLPYGEGIAFWALGEMVKSQAGLLDTDSAPVAHQKVEAVVAAAVPPEDRDWVSAHLRPLVGLPGITGSDSTDAFGAWRLFFESLAEHRPLVLVFEDLHWADDGLLDFVDHLADWAAGVPLLVVCSARPELLERRPAWGGGKLNATTLALASLPPEDSARLVATLLEQPLLPAELQRALLDRAEGNPLYAEQYVRMLADRGFLVRGMGGWELAKAADLPLPESLQGIIAARLDGLPATEKHLLQDAAVIGKVFWAGALGRERVELRDVIDQLHSLERKGFVRRERRSSVADETEYAFGHALVRDVAYGQIPRIERARKHRAAAEWIEELSVERSEDHAQLAAHHWVQALELSRAAGAVDADLEARARAALVVAGDRAQGLGASGAAADLYAAALALVSDDDPARPGLLLRHGRALAQTGVDTDAELAEATELLLASGDVERAVEAVLARCWIAWNQGRPDDALALYERGLELVADRPASTPKAQLHGDYAINLMLKGRVDEGTHHAAVELEIGREIGVDLHRANALITLGTIRAGWWHDPDGFAQVEQGRELARGIGDGQLVMRGYKNLQSLLGLHAELDRARAVVEDGLRTATRLGDFHHVGWFQVELGHFAYLAGDWDEAAGSVRGFLDDLGDRDHYMAGPARQVLGRIEVARGDLAAGLRDSTIALDFARAVRDHQQLMPALASHAWVLARAGRSGEAHSLLDEYLAIVDLPHNSVVDAALVLRQLDRAADFERIPDRTLATPWGTSAGAFARGDFAGAAAGFEAIGARVYEADARLRLAERLAADGRVSEAGQEAHKAGVIFERAGAEPLVAEASSVVRASA